METLTPDPWNGSGVLLIRFAGCGCIYFALHRTMKSVGEKLPCGIWQFFIRVTAASITDGSHQSSPYQDLKSTACLAVLFTAFFYNMGKNKTTNSHCRLKRFYKTPDPFHGSGVERFHIALYQFTPYSCSSSSPLPNA